jgi:hypothetical protein
LVEQLFDPFGVGRGHDGGFAQLPLLFLRFVAEHMARVGVMAFQFSFAGHFETLRGAFMSFHFWHE